MATYEDWFEKVIKDKQASAATPRDMKYAMDRYGTPGYKTVAPNWTLPPGLADAFSREGWEKRAREEALEKARIGISGTPLPQSPSPMDIPNLPFSVEPPAVDGGGGGGGGLSISSVFAPLFDSLNQQRANANSRYTANSGQIQNIYGQIIGARSADIDDIDEAYTRLQKAAASRGESTLGKMEQREQNRQSNNQSVLDSMGLGDIGSAVDDVAAQSAAVAQDVEMMNQSNWAGMLDVMGKTSQELARADITSYGYSQMEDIAQLQAAKEDYLQNIAGQEFELKFQEQQQKLAAAQAAAQAEAANQAAIAKAQAQAQEDQFDMTLDYLKTADPLSRAIGEESLYRGGLSPADQANVQSAYQAFLSTADFSRVSGINAQQALADLNNSGYSEQLSPQGMATLQKAVLYAFSQ